MHNRKMPKARYILVVKVLEDLAHTNGADEEEKDEATKAEVVRWWNPEHKFKVKCIQLCQQEL